MTDIRERRITLIGGAGFIGHHLALELKRRGADVSIVDNLLVNNLLSFASAGSDSHNPDLYLRIINERLDLLRQAGVPLYVLDARDYHNLSHILGKTQPQVIVHLAAVAHANVSNKDPYSTFDHSLRTLENALDNARGKSLAVEQFIYFSSSMVYGNFRSETVGEDEPCDPIGIYGALKRAGEQMVIAYNQVFGLPYTIIRPSALYGERCVSRRVGQIFIESALRDGEVSVHGDGQERLDFTHVADLVDGVIAAMERPEARNEIFNLTFGQGRSLAEMAEILCRHFPEVAVRYLPRDRLMPVRGTLSIDKARRLLGYEPKWPLEKGFARYIDWYRSLTHENCILGKRAARRELAASAAR